MLSRARLGARNRGRRSTLEMPLPKLWQAQHSVHVSVCVCLRGRGSIWQLSKGLRCCRARGSGRAKSWQPQHFGDAIAEVVAGAAFCASERVFAWQGQHLAAVKMAAFAAVPEHTIEPHFRTPQSKDSDAWMIWKLLASAVAFRLEVLSALQRRMHGARLADTCCA